jgi:hypothetical protein
MPVSAIAAPFSDREPDFALVQNPPSQSNHNTALLSGFNHLIGLNLGNAWRRDRPKHQGGYPQEIAVLVAAGSADGIRRDPLV